MSLEKSVLDIAKIRGLLSSEYGLELLDCISLELGSANCYKVHCKEGVFFFNLLKAVTDIKSIWLQKQKTKKHCWTLRFGGLISAERYTKKHLKYQRHYYKENANMEICR